MGGHHNEMPKIPDWKMYRVDVPELMQVKKALARHGLTDPWLRNEVWKYTKYKGHTFWGNIRWYVTQGMKFGIPARILTALIELSVFPIRNPYGDEHGHH